MPTHLHFVEARCCDVSPTSSSALCGQPAPNRRLVWFSASRTGSCHRPTASAHSTRSCIVLPYLDLYLYLTCTGQGAHQAQQTCKRQCARGCPPCHSKTGSPHRHLRHPPRCRSADGFCLRLPRAVAQPALLHLFAVLQSESVRPAICDLLTVNRSPRAIRAGRPQTQQPPFRTIFSPATCRTSSA